jgi:hypothetical protein
MLSDVLLGQGIETLLAEIVRLCCGGEAVSEARLVTGGKVGAMETLGCY